MTSIPAYRRPAPDVAASIGDTPLVALDRLFPPDRFRVHAKMEGLNPGGSVKDRTARSIIEHALATGDLVPGFSTVVESTSGNLGIALAQLCNLHGLGLVCVTDARATRQNVAVMRAYGARVECVERDSASGEYLPARIARVRHLLATLPGAYWPDQYANELGALAHHTTMREICEALPLPPDHLFLAAGTTGTLRGCAEYVRDHGLPTRITAVDAVGSVIFGPTEPWERHHRRAVPGHGAALAPPLLRPGLADRVVKVTDFESVEGCRALLARESVLAGGSSGAVVTALRRSADLLEPGASVAVILPDRGERYLDTVYRDSWVQATFGRLPSVDGDNAPPRSPDPGPRMIAAGHPERTAP
ncbi:2,3-diaminopropionate biosynthesis protein SbnA [Streptomyces solincola]|uniref:N-(2-amino-2-carboxyethyl)-L-glutamate synthase n=1 Tax=Streptomyces solincola TaxID=2100817 RepID=A0A2S9PQF2_9ACTN|nr:2,3-diaminopropionate biosynthesis protein SbnA [Streptomyces solincola]PRH76631.1 2,3-diaminopropionate biosynthesis protein SbnA [Streptomyces solincola]